MRNKLSVLFFLMGTLGAIAQNYSGTAIYQMKMSSHDFRNEVLSDPKMDAAMKAFIEERMKKMFSKTYVLDFNKNASIYKEQQELSTTEGITVMSTMGLDIALFKDIKNGTQLIEKELMGKSFTVKDSLKKRNWKIENETKKIGEYTCYKAVFKIPVSPKETEEFEMKKLEQSKNSTQLLKVSEPKEKVVTVWFTPEIPVNHGPENYWGLPGLILEVTLDKATILCTKITLNTKGEMNINLKPKGELISQKQYDEIVEQKTKELEANDYMPGN